MRSVDVRGGIVRSTKGVDSRPEKVISRFVSGITWRGQKDPTIR